MDDLFSFDDRYRKWLARLGWHLAVKRYLTVRRPLSNEEMIQLVRDEEIVPPEWFKEKAVAWATTLFIGGPFYRVKGNPSHFAMFNGVREDDFPFPGPPPSPSDAVVDEATKNSPSTDAPSPSPSTKRTGRAARTSKRAPRE